MQTDLHVARLAAAHSALLALLMEMRAEQISAVDGVSVTLTLDDRAGDFQVVYTVNGQPVGGEGF